MKKEDAPIAKMFLRLKAKAADNLAWTQEEASSISNFMRRGGELGVLAACCILASGVSNGRAEALQIIKKAFELDNPSPYLELSIYEAATCIKANELVPICSIVMTFINKSLLRRSINLDNTIFLIGILARFGESQPLKLLQTLASDANSEVSSHATYILQGLKK